MVMVTVSSILGSIQRTVSASVRRERSASVARHHPSVFFVSEEVLLLCDSVEAVSSPILWSLGRSVGVLEVELLVKVRQKRRLVDEIKVLFIQLVHQCLFLLFFLLWAH